MMVAANRATCYYPIFCIEDYYDDLFDFSSCSLAKDDINYSGNQRWNGCFYHKAIDVFPLPGEYDFPWELYDFYECGSRGNVVNASVGGGPGGVGGPINDKVLASGLLSGTHGGSTLSLFGTEDTVDEDDMTLITAVQQFQPINGASTAAGDYEITESCNSNLIGIRFKLNKYSGVACPISCFPAEWDQCPCDGTDWLNEMGVGGSGICGDSLTTLHRRYHIVNYNEDDFTPCSTCINSSIYPPWQGDFYASGSSQCSWRFFDERLAVADRTRSLPIISAGRSELIGGKIFRDATTGFWIVWWACETAGIYAPAQHMYVKLIDRDPPGIYRRVSKDFFNFFDASIACEQTCIDGDGPEEIEIG